MLLSYCVVNTNGRDHLATCLDAIVANHPSDVEAEILVLDNASDDGSAELVREWQSAGNGPLANGLRLIALERRLGKAANDSLLMEQARGEFCLLLNEDAEVRPGCVEALLTAMRAYPQAGAAGAQLLDSKGNGIPCAWRLPGIGASLASAFLLHKRFVTESGPGPVREVGWAQSAAMIVRREAAADIDYLDPDFFVYSDETDFCKRLRDAGWVTLHVPAARAIHHEQLATDRSSERRLVEFHRNRDLYMRKHHGPAVAAICRCLNALPYLYRAAAATVLPGHSPSWYLLHARLCLNPTGEGIREAAAAYNARLDG